MTQNLQSKDKSFLFKRFEHGVDVEVTRQSNNILSKRIGVVITVKPDIHIYIWFIYIYIYV